MLTNLQQLPAWAWLLAVLVIVAASAMVIWVRRNYKPGTIKAKFPLVEVELARKEKEKTAAVTQPPSPDSAPAQPMRSQEMLRSEAGEQRMHGKGGVQKQKMSDSPDGKQTMD